MDEVPVSKTRILLSVIGAYLLMIVTFFVGAAGHFIYWLLFDSFGREEARAKRTLKTVNDLKDDEQYAIIIGAGFSGLGMAIRLNQLGMDKYLIIERHGKVGGTWYANQYPGCACDVPSYLYSFSFETNPNWSHFFGRQPEIGDYLNRVTDKYDIRRHIQFNTSVTKLNWLDDRQLWRVTVDSNGDEKEYYARFVMAGQGPLSNASYPTDIPGLGKFRGQMCHTAEWNKSIDFSNKRVAIVGTGASAIQVVPEIHKRNLKQMVVFQRTPAWIIPRADRVVPQWEKSLYNRYPIFQKFVRAFVYWIRESTVLSFTYRLPVRYLNEQLVKFNLRRQVKDKELRKKLTPNFDLGCKRVLLSNDWYSTLQQPNVQLVTNRIKEVTEDAIVTHDGDRYPVDIIVWSTGFQVQKFPIEIYGTNGRSIFDQWAQSMQAYRGVTVPNFPNLFLLLGPNTGLGHNSVVVMIEAQIQYISEALLCLGEKRARSLEVKNEVSERFNRKLQSDLKKTVWQSGGCHSWYQDSKGNNTTIWPDFTWIYILLMKAFDSQNYLFQ